MKYAIKRYLLFLVGFVLLLSLIIKLNVGLSVFQSVKHVYYIFIAFLISLAALVIKALRVKYLLDMLDETSKNFKELVKIEFANVFIYSTTIGKIHLPAKAIFLNKISRVRIQNSVSVATFEYGLDIFVFLLLGTIGGIFFFSDYVALDEIKLVLFIALIPLLVFFGLPSQIFDELNKKAESSNNIITRKFLGTFIKSMKIIRKMIPPLIINKKLVIYIIPILLLQWLAIGSVYKFLFLSMDYNISLIYIIIVVGSTYLVSGAAQIPAGLGIREATMILLYGTFGIPRSIAFIVAILDRLLLTAIAIIGYKYATSYGAKVMLQTD